jgi:8-oxo-dGTP diphosphatase
MDDTTKDTKKVVVCLIRNDEGKLLMIRPNDYKKDFGEYLDAWYPPTGHIKEDEDEKEAIVREMKEELGVRVEPIKLMTEWEQDIPGEWAYWWECRIVEGEIKRGVEIAECKFFFNEELKNLKLWPAEIKFFEKFFW